MIDINIDNSIQFRKISYETFIQEVNYAKKWRYIRKKYEVIKILGKGGMGTVYLCKNTILGNFWAIKEVIKDRKNIDVLTEANILKDLTTQVFVE